MTCRIKTPAQSLSGTVPPRALSVRGITPLHPPSNRRGTGANIQILQFSWVRGFAPRRHREEPAETCVVRGITPPSGARVDNPRGVNTCSRAQKSALAVRKKLFGDLPPLLLIELLNCGSMMTRFTGNRPPPSRPTMKNFDSETGKGTTAGIFG